jgi:hypothetical protein
MKIKQNDIIPDGFKLGRKIKRVAGNAPVLSSLEG